MKITLPFNKIRKEDVSLAGGKGASLGEMTSAGIPVPDGFVVLSNVFDEFIKETDLNIEIDAVLDTVNIDEVHTVENASEKIQALILNSEMPKDIAKEIQNSFNKLDSEFVAVRSSATSEDSASAAWAGQLDSFLNTTKETLLENVRKCWASLFTPRAIFYRFEKKLHGTQISVAVVVQKMVNSEKSGIAFSVHPVTEDYNQIIIEAGFGLGEAIVSGSITPDSYVIDNQDWHTIDINVNNQSRGLFRKKGGGNEWKDLGEKGKEQVLNIEEIINLGKMIKRIEDHYTFPVDVEWAYESNKFYITQSRPITTLTKEEENENLNLLLNLKQHSFEQYERGPVQPVISYESAFRSYMNNRFMKDTPNLLILQHENYEAWEEKSSRPIISDKKKIREIIKFSLKKIEEYKSQLNNFLKDKDLDRENAIKGLEFLDKLCIDIYQGYIFFCVEYFETDDEELIRILPEVRVKLSNFIKGVWEAYDKILFFCEKEFGLKKSFGDMCSSEEINNLLKGDRHILEIENLDKRAIVFSIIKNSFKIYFDKEAEIIIDYLKSQNPLLKNIRYAKEKGLLNGNIAYKGKLQGRVIKLTESDYSKYDEKFKDQKGYILVTPMTRPEIVPYIKGASSIITDEGGITCHAAIISRELKIPCIIGTKIATQVLHDGDLVEVDANNGIIKILK